MLRIREETFELEDGLGVLRLLGNYADTALLCNGKPIALMIPDNQGSVAQILAYAGVLDTGDPLDALRGIARGHLLESAPLWSQMFPLLRLFESGLYCLRERTADVTWDIAEHPGTMSRSQFYPVDTFVMTRPKAGLSRGRIDEWKSRIADGERPIAFCCTTDAAAAPFVIDGHHKLHAYWESGVAPRVIEIISKEPQRLSELQERVFFPESGPYQEVINARKRGKQTWGSGE